MARHILPFLFLISTLSSAQGLPDAPKPKPSKPAQRMTFFSPIARHKKAAAITGFAAFAAATTAIVLANRSGNEKHFLQACACPAKVPKR
jgi:hypothetical protein